jgi:hypothetical protein
MFSVIENTDFASSNRPHDVSQRNDCGDHDYSECHKLNQITRSFPVRIAVIEKTTSPYAPRCRRFHFKVTPFMPLIDI